MSLVIGNKTLCCFNQRFPSHFSLSQLSSHSTSSNAGNKKSSDPIIGIDLGTTNSCVSVIEGGEAVVHILKPPFSD